MSHLNAGGEEPVAKEDEKGNNGRGKNVSKVGQAGGRGVLTLDKRRDPSCIGAGEKEIQMGMNAGRWGTEAEGILF